jgi:hypothetical protein
MAVVGAIVLSAAGVTASAAVTYAVGVAVVATVSAVALSAALDDKLKGLNQGGASRGLTNQIDPVGDFDLVYGETRKGGLITYAEVSSDNKYLHRFLILAGHEVDSIGDIYIQDEIVSFASGSEGYVTTGAGGTNWNQKIYIKKFTGSPTQNVYSDLQSLTHKPTDINSTFKGQGIACLYIRMEYDADTFSGGTPLITAKVRGKKVYDPRKDSTSSAYDNSLGVSTHRTNDPTTWQYSDEPALAIRDYLTSDFGVGAEQTSIDDDMIATAIAACASTGTSGVEENSFKINGTVTTGGTPQQNLNAFMTTLNGTLFYGQGKWRLLAGAYTSPDASVSGANAFGYDDIISDIGVSTRFSRRDTVNTVKGTFIDGSASGRYIPTDYPQQQIPSLSEDNGQESVLDLTLPLTTNSATAQRLAKQVLFVGREQISVTATFTLEKAFSVQVGDTIELRLKRYGWIEDPEETDPTQQQGKQFKVMGWKMSGLDGSNPSVSLNLQETSPTVYQWSVSADEYQAITHNNTSLGDNTSGLAISGLAATLASTLQTDGTTMSRVVLSWNAVSNAQIRHYEVQWKPSSLSNYSSTIAPNNAIEIEPLTAGTTYNFRVRAITVNENAGAYATINATAVKDTTAPDIPSAPTVTAGVKQLEVSWKGYNFPSDFASMEVYHSTSSSGTYSLIGTSAGTSLVHSGLTQNTTHYYKLLAKDFSGNPPTTTPQEIAAKLSPAGSGTVAADVQGLTGVPVMTSNAYYNSTSDTTPNQNGRIYFGVSASDPDTQASDGPFPSTIYIRLDEDGRALASDLSSLINLDTDLTQAVSTGGSGILIYENDQNWGWYTPSGVAGGFSTSGGYYFMEGTLQSSEGNIDVLSQWYRIGVGKKGAQGQSGLIVTLNGSDIIVENIDPRDNTSTVQAALNTAFLAANPLLSAMSDIPDNAVIWARFVNSADTEYAAGRAPTQFSARKWVYADQDWTDNAATFENPAIFSPLVIAAEAIVNHQDAISITAEQLTIAHNINYLDGGGWKIGKDNYADTADGLWIGNPAGTSEFALATGANSGTATEHGILFDINETKLINPTIMSGTGSLQSAVSVASNISNVQISDSNGKLPSNTSLPVTALSISAVGGGGGGKGAEGGANGSNGSNTVYTLTGSYLGAATSTIVSVTALGGAGATSTYSWYGQAGVNSNFASGGTAANASFGSGGNGSQGSGGGGAGGRQPATFTSSTVGGSGGSAGTNATDFIELDGYTDVRLTITLGSGGSGGASARFSASGGDGGAGFATYQIQTSSLEQVYLSPNSPIGIGQTWTDFPSGRSSSVHYRNTTEKPILVNVGETSSGTGAFWVWNSQSTTPTGTTGGVQVGGTGTSGAFNSYAGAIVPVGGWYYVTGGTPYIWAELR